MLDSTGLTGQYLADSVVSIYWNRWTVFSGFGGHISRNTHIEAWWRLVGQHQYPNADRLLILADCGGSNSARSRAWKYELQEKLCRQYGLEITICHFPPGCSKWNPIEHRLFSAISRNWSGVPLRSWETIINYIRTTTTIKGLSVTARLELTKYVKGKRISDVQMRDFENRYLLCHEEFPS